MSIQVKEYKSKKTGKKTKRYYACVFDAATNSIIWGKGRSKRSDAIKDEADILKDLEAGKPRVSGKMLFRELAKLWFESTKNTYAESTWKGYKGYYNAQLAPVFDEIYVNKITSVHAQKFKNALSEKYKPATVNKTMDLLSMMMDFAMQPLKLIAENPCNGIKRDKVETPTHTTWDEKTIGYFLSLPDVINSDYYEMLLLSFTTALRPGEVCGVSTTSLKGDNLLSLNRGYNKYGNVTDMKTPGSHRPLLLDPFVYRCLEKKLEKKKQQKLDYINKTACSKQDDFSLAETGYNDNDFLFTYENGDPITPNSYSRAFRTLIENHNKRLKEIESAKGKIPANEYYLPKIRLYDCRHSFATNNILNGENPKIISEVMGSNVSTVMKNYVHLSRATHQATLSKYSSKIFKFDKDKNRKTV